MIQVPAVNRPTDVKESLKSTSTLVSKNSTTTDWMRTSLNGSAPLSPAASISLDLEHTTSSSSQTMMYKAFMLCNSPFQKTGPFQANPNTYNYKLHPIK